MHTQLKCIFYIYFKYVYTLLLTYSYTVFKHIRHSIHAPPNPYHNVIEKVVEYNEVVGDINVHWIVSVAV